ncbi:M20/M25/M40 family metallo-hydrolase [bacterium]|nr:M20/M25/M40 family metallo-hydrolase [bacterium]
MTLSTTQSNVLEHITEERWITLATQLIKTGQPQACDPLDPDLPSGQEEAIAMLVAGKLEALGMSVETYESMPQRPNVVGVLKGSGDGPVLMMNDHMDTYPVVEPHKWDKTDFNPFKATRHGDLLFARGSSDTRGNMASAILAAQALKDEGIQLKGDLMYCLCVDEERDGTHGSIYLMNEVGIKADYSITAEPTAWENPTTSEWGMNLSIANGGHCLVEIKVVGQKAHIWRPDTSNNAIVEVAELIPLLQGMEFTHEPTEFMGHTPPCVTIVRIRGGLPGEMQFSPDECVLTLAVVGIVPGMTIDSVIKDLTDVADPLFKDREDISFAVNQVPNSLFVDATEPVSVDDEPCKSISKSYALLMGGKLPIPNRKNAFNDTIRFRDAGINAVTFGPGEDGWDPDNESISITKAVTAAKIYALTIMEILGVSNSND